MELIAKSPTARVFVKDHSFVGAARRKVKELAESAGLNSEALGKVELLTTELATNLAKHATTGGELLVLEQEDESSSAICLLCIDRGPGIDDVEQVLIDGVSGAGTLGAGLGTLKRLSDSFEISSAINKGTVVLCKVFKEAAKGSQRDSTLDVAAISVPHPGESCCGDNVSYAQADDVTSILVVDALGHGDGAALVAEKAVEIFDTNPFDDSQAIIGRIHSALSGTRGASLAILKIEHAEDRLKFVGVGNITSRIYTRFSSKGCVSVQGIVGTRMSSLKEFVYDWEPGAKLLMYSDGLKSAASLDDAQPKSALILAAELYRDFCRLTDDTTVVVVKDKRRK